MIETRLITVRDYWALSAGDAAAEVFTPVRFEEIERHMKRFILPALGNTRIMEITEEAVSDFMDSLRGESIYVKTSVRAIMNWLFEMAVRERLTACNPVSGYSVKKFRVERIAFMMPDEMLMNIAEQIKGTRWQNLIMSVMLSGLSPVELCGIADEDYDIGQGTLCIKRFVQMGECRGSRKNYYAARLEDEMHTKLKRRIYVPHDALAWIENERRTVSCEKPMTEGPDGGQVHLVFSDKIGNPVILGNIRDNIRYVGKLLGIPGLNVTMLMDNWGVRAAGSGVSPKELQKYLGYKSFYTVSKYYDSTGLVKKWPAVENENYYREITG